jgi:hypothetical protein
MEQWRKELESVLKQGLEDLDKEYEEIYVQELFEQLMEESSSSPKRAKVGGSRPRRRFVYCTREACDEQLY